MPDAASDPSIEFLLAEHGRLVQLFLNTRESSERRVTLYLTLVTGVLTATAALFQLQLTQDTELLFALSAAVGLFVLGLITFLRLVERSLQGTEYLRAINRIHRYFTDRDPALTRYLFWPSYDNVPRYNRQSVGGAETREIVAILNSLFAGILAGLGLYLLQVLLVGVLLGAVIALLTTLLAHIGWEHNRFGREERRQAYKVKFPSPTGAGAIDPDEEIQEMN